VTLELYSLAIHLHLVTCEGKRRLDHLLHEKAGIAVPSRSFGVYFSSRNILQVREEKEYEKARKKKDVEETKRKRKI
jgi:hypothetical protein